MAGHPSPGVLNRIALCYTATALLFLAFGKRIRILVAVTVGLLLGYWALMALVPIRDIRLDAAALAPRMEAAGHTNVAVLFAAETGRVRGNSNRATTWRTMWTSNGCPGGFTTSSTIRRDC